jgi:PAS domain S-box-containing protein
MSQYPSQCRWSEESSAFRRLFTEHATPMWIFERDSLVFLAVNEAALQKYAWSRDALIRMGVDDVRSPDDVPPVRKAREALLAAPGGSIRVPWRHRVCNNGFPDAESTWSEIRFADRAAILVVLMDAAALEPPGAGERPDQIDAVRGGHDAVIVRDFDDHIVFWSDGAERIYGIERENAIGCAMSKIVPGDAELFARAAPALLSAGEWTAEIEQTRADGSHIRLKMRWSLLCTAAGNPTAILLMNTDLAEAQRAESRYLRTQRLETVGALAGGIAHDLNNILSPILMSIGVLRGTTQDPAAQRMLNIIETSAQRGTGVVKQVFTFARGLDGERVLLQPKHLVNDVSKLIAPTLPRNIDLRTEFPADLWTVNGDPMQLHQVLLNLCVRARDAMPGGGTLTIGAENVAVDARSANAHGAARTGPHVLLRVADTNAAPAAGSTALFTVVRNEPPAAPTDESDLATVRRILETHGGFFSVENAPDNGTIFKAFLPALAESVKEAESVDLGPVPRGNGELVLIVDDEMLIRETLVQTLQANGYQVYTAEDGSDALALYFQRRDAIDLVVTDLSMGQMDGLTLARSLRRVNPAARVIVSSAQLQKETVAILRSLGVTSFLDKPYTAEKLLRTVRAVLDAPPPGR